MQWLAKQAGKEEVKDDTGLIKEIFTEANYRHMKAQSASSYWTADEIKVFSACKVTVLTDDSASNRLKRKIFLSKPLYTKNGKYALVYYHYKSMLVLRIFQKIKNEWVKRKFIPLGSE